MTEVKKKIMGRRGDLTIQKVSTEYRCSETAVGMEEKKIRNLRFIHSDWIPLLAIYVIMSNNLNKNAKNKSKITL
ncbi:unnamed protein product [Rhizophagus irregularis]|nr:unnamed protein product [Rhizophagus irregularis]